MKTLRTFFIISSCSLLQESSAVWRVGQQCLGGKELKRFDLTVSGITDNDTCLAACIKANKESKVSTIQCC